MPEELQPDRAWDVAFDPPPNAWRQGYYQDLNGMWIPVPNVNPNINAQPAPPDLAQQGQQVNANPFAGAAQPDGIWGIPPLRYDAAADMRDFEAQLAAANAQAGKSSINEYFKSENDNMKPIKKKPKKKEKEYTEAQLKECRERISIFAGEYKLSYPCDWQEYNGIGWVHSQEIDRFTDSYGQCFYSKAWLARNQLSKTCEGKLICKDEIKNNGWALCQHSESWTKAEDLVDANIGLKKVRISKRWVDAGEYFRCTLSNKFYNRQSRINVRGSERFTCIAKEEAARSDRVTKCESCGAWVEAEIVRPHVWDRGNVRACDPCHHREMAKNLIRAHNFNEYPAAIYRQIKNWRMVDHGENGQRRRQQIEDPGIRLFGVEVETEMSKNSCVKAGVDRFVMAAAIRDTLGENFVMIKEDGSLSLNGHYAQGGGSVHAGFEVVSAPADIEVHRQKWPLLEQMAHFKHLRAWDTDTCGFHVHVSKDALTTLQIGRILMFMTHNNNKRFIAKVAGRSENRYCKAFHKNKFSDGIQYGEAEVRNGVEYVQANFTLPRSDDSRRQAVNITNPRTIEFRIFRGTVHPRHIIRNIEFCDAMCSFCHPGSRSLTELWDWKNFIHFCAENRKTYPMFVEWLESEEASFLPKRNAYGPKDTRGTKRPAVVEAGHDESKKPTLADAAAANGIPLGIPMVAGEMPRWARLVVPQQAYPVLRAEDVEDEGPARRDPDGEDA